MPYAGHERSSIESASHLVFVESGKYFFYVHFGENWLIRQFVRANHVVCNIMRTTRSAMGLAVL